MLQYAREYEKHNIMTGGFEQLDHAMNEHAENGLLAAQVSAQETRIERLEAWILEVITKPSMPRELRLEGLDLMAPASREVHQAVERVCPTQNQSQQMEREQSIQR
jgi:hypothetical protein